MGEVVNMQGDTIVGRPDSLAAAAAALRAASDYEATVTWEMEPARAAEVAEAIERGLGAIPAAAPRPGNRLAELRGRLAGWTWRDWLLPGLALWLAAALLWG